MKEKDIERLTADAELWESGKLGNSAKHVRVISEEEGRAIDNGLGLQLISLRLSKQLIGQFKELAKLEGIGYQPLIRQALVDYAKKNEKKLDVLLSASQATKKAEQLFTEALKCEQVIAALTPLSNKRIEKEHAYTTCLSQANDFFRQAYKNSSDLILKRHAKLRLAQIEALVQKDLPKDELKKYDKRKKYA